MENKECTKCGEVKALDRFSRLAHGKDGRRGQCKACDKAYSQKVNKRIPVDSAKYEINQQTMRNHMFLHFGFWEPQRGSMERMQDRRDIRKYYKEEQTDKKQ